VAQSWRARADCFTVRSWAFSGIKGTGTQCDQLRSAQLTLFAADTRTEYCPLRINGKRTPPAPTENLPPNTTIVYLLHPAEHKPCTDQSFPGMKNPFGKPRAFKGFSNKKTTF